MATCEAFPSYSRMLSVVVVAKHRAQRGGMNQTICFMRPWCSTVGGGRTQKVTRVAYVKRHVMWGVGCGWAARGPSSTAATAAFGHRGGLPYVCSLIGLKTEKKKTVQTRTE